LDPRSRIPNITKIKFLVVKFMNYIVYSLEKYRKRRKIILCINVYYSNHLIRQEKIGFILHLSFLSRIRDPDTGSGMTRNAGSRIRDDKKGRIRIRDHGQTSRIRNTGYKIAMLTKSNAYLVYPQMSLT
jgi:hypothetical protein